jgi:PAS domain S-box-containing protein
MTASVKTSAITNGGRRHDSLSVGGLLRSVMSVSPLSMVLTDPHRPDYPLIFVNRAFTALTGFSEEEVLGRNCRLLQGPETDRTAVRVLGDAVAVVGEAQVDLWNYRKNGSQFWNSMYVGPIFGRDGRLLYYFGSQTDASVRREVDEARSQAQRMDTLGSLAAGIAHEVNNLMTVIVGNTDRLLAADLEPKQLERLQRIDWAARETGKLTQQMLSFAGKQTLSIEAVDLNEVLRRLDRLLIQVAASGRRVVVAPQDEPVMARIDVGQLQLALINLVRNASDASTDGDQIIVGSRSGIQAEAAVAEIFVRDVGLACHRRWPRRRPNRSLRPRRWARGLGLGCLSSPASASSLAATCSSKRRKARVQLCDWFSLRHLSSTAATPCLGRVGRSLQMMGSS